MCTLVRHSDKLKQKGFAWFFVELPWVWRPLGYSVLGGAASSGQLDYFGAMINVLEASVVGGQGLRYTAYPQGAHILVDKI